MNFVVRIKLVLFAAILSFAVGAARADNLITLPNSIFWTGPILSSPHETFGYSFTVSNAPLSVSALGLFGHSFSTEHSIGLWSDSGALLASVVIPTGPAGFLEGRFEYITLQNPIVLNAHETYIVGASYASSEEALWLYLPNVNTADVYVYSTSVVPGDIRENNLPGFSFPALSLLPGGAFGPNARFDVVPEPSIPVFVLVVIVVIGFVSRLGTWRSNGAVAAHNRP